MARKPALRRSLPVEFNTLGDHFYQDVFLDAQTLPELAAQLAHGFSEGEQPARRAYLTGLVDGEEVHRLLAAVRDALGQGRTQPGWKPVRVGTNHARRGPAPKRR